MSTTENQEGMVTRDWKESPTGTGLVFLVVLLSPFGAPLLAFATMAACDLSWDGPYECAVPSGLFSYFFISFLAPYFVLGWAGIVWFALGLSAVAISARWFVMACFAALADRL